MSAHFASSHQGSSHYLSSYYGRTAVIREEDGYVYPVGGGEDAEARRTRILLEDEIIMVLIASFLQIKDR